MDGEASLEALRACFEPSGTADLHLSPMGAGVVAKGEIEAGRKYESFATMGVDAPERIP